MNITIVPPDKKDEEEIKKLFKTVITQNFKDYGFFDTYEEVIDYEVRKQFTTLEEYFTSKGKKVYFLIAKDNDTVVGTIAYGKKSTDIEKYYPSLLQHIPEIKSVYILPKYQGKGIGTALLSKMIEVLEQKGFKDFCLDSGYPKAQEFWTKKLGEPVVRIHNRWGAGNDYCIWHYILE